MSGPTTYEEVDALIVGAGPSGSTAAIALFHPGTEIRKLIIADKATFPRDKPCGDGIGPGAVAVAAALGIQHVFDGFSPVTGVTVRGPNGIHFDSALPLIDGQVIEGYVVPRIEFDSRMLHEAQVRGADVRQEWRLEGLEKTHDDRWLAQFSTKTGTRFVRARMVVGADGANSRVRRFLSITPNSDKMTGIAIRSYATGWLAERSHNLLFEWSERLLPAYAWVFPLGRDHANIGLGVLVSDLKRRKLRLPALLDEFQLLLKQNDIDITQRQGERSYLLPHAGQMPRLSNDHVILIGDAASMINPLSGEGIFYGMAAGQMLGEAVADSGISSTTFDRFERRFRARFVSHFRSNAIAAKMLRTEPGATVMIRAAAKSDDVIADGVELLFGEGRIKMSGLQRLIRYGAIR